MARVLFAWELGDNFGHLASFAPVAQRLVDGGHEVVAVVQNVAVAEAFLPPERMRCLQAPLWRPRERRSASPTLCYADVLAGLGYDDAAGLAMLMRAWRVLFELLRPDLLVADSAPTAMLAARGLPFHRVGHATGYSLPPKRAPMPSLRPWDSMVTPEVVARREAAVVATVREALGRCGLPTIEHAWQVLESELDLLRTLPELDHYADRGPPDARTIYAGPSFSLDAGEAVEWPDGAGPRIFAYLRPGSTHCRPMLQALTKARARVLAAVPGLPSEPARALAARHVRVVPRPVRLRGLREGCELAIGHGGHGTLAAFALAGVPQLLLPNRLEQLLAAGRLEQAGAGVVPPPGDAPRYAALLERALRPELRHGAQALAARHPGMTLERQTAAVVDALTPLLR